MKNRLLTIAIVFFFAPFCFLGAQVTVTPSTGQTPQNLVNNVLVGGGVNVSNVKFNGVSTALTATTGAQIGTFSNNLSVYPTLGFSSGLIIATGNIDVAPGPNNENGASNEADNNVSCPELANLISGYGSPYNPAVLEFDFVTVANSVAFRYVFASEEYPDYVGTNYNDVFGFFVTDLVTNVTKNIALIPGTTLPVTINNVNYGSYSQYYNVVPDGSTAMQYNAHLSPFTAAMDVVPCRMYHMKIAITNVSDALYDSAVFLEAKSFNAPAVGDLLVYDDVDIPFVIYGCNNATLTFSIPEPVDYDTTLILTYSGTAVNGIDYEYLPDSITIPAGQTESSLQIVAISGDSPDTLELIISYSNNLCNNTEASGSVSINLIRFLPHTVINATVCAGEPYTENDFNIPGTSGGQGGLFTYQNSYQMANGCDSVVDLYLTVIPVPQTQFTVDPEYIIWSEGSEITFTNTSDVGMMGGYDYVYTWDFGDGSTEESNSTVVSHQYDTWGEYLVTLSLEIEGCSSTASHYTHIEEDLIFPNVITPNGDGVNDEFIIGNLSPDMPNSLHIYDRWGKKIYHMENYKTYQKDGVLYNLGEGFSGEKNSDGVYYYVFYYTGYTKTFEYSGSITVIRSK
ncbi:MAG: choice-of-anchor L domain-containing protein [Bacteroidales bacterium]|nr:choice-of-anchor L domain-containing protein [Bacteroidales bacterium]